MVFECKKPAVATHRNDAQNSEVSNGIRAALIGRD